MYNRRVPKQPEMRSGVELAVGLSAPVQLDRKAGIGFRDWRGRQWRIGSVFRIVRVPEAFKNLKLTSDS